MKVTAANAKKTADIIIKRLQEIDAYIESFKGADNPQTVLLAQAAHTKRETLQDVLDSLKGNSVALTLC